MSNSFRPPNILLLISHDLGSHVGPYGFAVERTPCLNRFAAEGIRLDRHFVTSPGCSQSRSSLVTGRYPHNNGQFGLANWGWKLHQDEQLLPQLLRDAGYQSLLFGIWHLHEWTLSAFDAVSKDVSTLDSSPEGYAEVASQRAAQWLQSRAPDDPPFYLHVGFWEVHRPFCTASTESAEGTGDELSDIPVPSYLPDNEPTRSEFAELMRSIAVVDQGVERILQALQESGEADNTIVVFTADHGLPFVRAKGTLYDPGIQVACLARWPGHIPAGESTADLSSNIDLLPTLLEAARVPVPDNVQGVSRLARWTGDDAAVPAQAVFAEKTYHEHYDPIRCVRTDSYKYIRNFESRPMLVLPSDVYNSPSRQSMMDDAALWTSRPTEELYNLVDDPAETRNLAEDPLWESQLADARRRLQQWMDDTDDPLRRGPITRATQDRTLAERKALGRDASVPARADAR